MSTAMRRAWVGLGANLGDPATQLRAALHALAELSESRLRAASRLYRSAPLGPQGQPDYCNAVAAVDTALSPEALLAALLDIERAAGRQRGADRWGPRCLDLDLLHVEGECRDQPGLRLPHPEIAHRPFVLCPWAELAPDLELPGLGRLATLAAACPREGLALWSDPGDVPACPPPAQP